MRSGIVSGNVVSVDLGSTEVATLDQEQVERAWASMATSLYDVDRLLVVASWGGSEAWSEYTTSGSLVERSVLSDGIADDDTLTIGLADSVDGCHHDDLGGPYLVVVDGAMSLVWDDARHDEVAVRIAAEALPRVLPVLLAEPAGVHRDLVLASPEELGRLAEWNDTSFAHDADRGLIALFDAQVARTPNASAVEANGETTTYLELSDLAGRVAGVLVERGVGAGDAVALCVERSVEMTVGILAILRSGAAYVPIDPAYPQERQDYMIADSDAAVVLTDTANESRLRSSIDPDIVVVVDVDVSSDASVNNEPRATGDDAGYVIYTSGSTGRPKGVAMPQRALSNLVEWQGRRAQAQPQPRTLQFSALSFDVSFQEIFSTWAAGGTLVLISESERRDSNSLLDSLIDDRIERLFLPFVALRALAQTAVRTQRFPTALREVYTAGEQLQVDETVRSFFSSLPQCVLENQYGPSETHVCSAHTLTGEPAAWATLPPIGGPIANSELLVLDRWRNPRPVGMPGELYVAGSCVADGYLNRPDLTDERFVELEFQGRQLRAYRTGDVVRWLDSGDLEFLGRADGQVKLRGFRVEPGEVTAVLSAAPGVKQAVAVVRDDVGGRAARMVGYLIADDPEAFDLSAVQQHAASKMPDYMVPTHWAVLDEMPLTPSGKLDQRSLPIPEFDRDALSSRFEAPHGERQEALVAIWSELLGVPRVGIADDFFDLGGDSLLAVEMMTMIHERLGLDLPLGALARTRTIAELDAVIDDDLSGVWGSLVPLRESGDRTPLFVVHGGSGNVATFPVLAEALPADQPVYALQWDGLDGSRGSRSIEAMADRYVDEIRSVQAAGPYRLAGQCVGGLVAREMAERLERDGDAVDFVVMYDSPNLDSPSYTPRRMPFPIFQLKRTLTSGSEMMERVRVHLMMWFRRPVPPRYRERYGSLSLIRAAWNYRPGTTRSTHRTIFMGTGLSNASNIALAGSWSDGALGWAHEESASFDVKVIEAEHNDLPYHPEAIDVLISALET